MKKFQKDREKVLGSVLAREQRECCADLASRAVHSRNENQQEQPLEKPMGNTARSRSHKFHKDLIGRRTPLVALLSVKMRDEFRGGRKCGENFA